MGAYSPAPVVTDLVYERVMERIIEPTIAGMTKDGMPYTGFLYAGLMIDADGNPRVIEFNCRFGDPETQPIMMRLKSDLGDLCSAAIRGVLNDSNVEWDPRPALGVVLAAGGYPGNYDKGHAIHGLLTDQPKHTKIFHAGTAQKDDQVVTSGGRVLCVTALGDTIQDARENAYNGVDTIQWQDMLYRRDIGWRAIDR
jgi:phosphoribosylamine--glycine ligase